VVAYDALPVTRDLAAAVAAEQEASRPVELVAAFEAHFVGLCRLAHLIVGDSALAEDIRHEADRESADEVVEAVRLLPERQKAAVLLRYYLDLPESEIADTLGTKVGTVKSQLAKARRNLEKTLAGAGDD
jgi:RNA polymerase sigma factor (sigma-70 family)